MLTLTDENFESELAGGGTLVVDFWGVWCPPCKSMNPIYEKVAEANPSLKFGKVNINENPGLATQFKVQSIPSFLVFKDGQLVHRWSGLTSVDRFSEILKEKGVL